MQRSQIFRATGGVVQTMREITGICARLAGMAIAPGRGMAAVMALVFLFAAASIGLMLVTAASSLSLSTIFAMACFVALATGVFVGTFIQARHWENET